MSFPMSYCVSGVDLSLCLQPLNIELIAKNVRVMSTELCLSGFSMRFMITAYILAAMLSFLQLNAKLHSNHMIIILTSCVKI